MNIFSKSGSRQHYPHQNHGSDYYKRQESGGFLGKILRLLFGSRSHSHSSDRYHRGVHGNHPKRRSWS